MGNKLTYNRPWLADYQRDIIDDPARYTVTEGSTKSGKSQSHGIWLYEELLKAPFGGNVWWTAPVYSQAEIMFGRIKRALNPRHFQINESKLTITAPNGAIMWFKSAEKPDNLFGDDVYAVVLDEYTRMRQDAWFAIRSTLTKTKGRAKFIGNVRGMGWGYQLAREVESGKMGEDWSYHKVTSADAVGAGILEQADIDDAEKTLPKGVFLELYYCIPNTASSDRFAYSFSKEKHIGSCQLNRELPVCLSFDFNVNPITCGVIQGQGSKINVLEQIKLENSDIYKLCDQIRIKYPNCLFLVTGDATGSNTSAMVQDNLNYYKIIMKQLGIPNSQMMVPRVNPPMAENQVLVNAILEHCDVTIDQDKAQPLIFDMEFVRMGIDGKIVKTDRNDPTQQADALDTFRYYLNRFYKDYIKLI